MIRMVLNGNFALNSAFAPVRLASRTAFFENNCVNTNKDRPVASVAEMFNRKSSLWQMRISPRVPNENLQFKMGLFSISVWVSSISRELWPLLGGTAIAIWPIATALS